MKCRRLLIVAVMFAGLMLAAVGYAGLPVTDGLVIHLDAGSITGVADGASVATWTDLSGRGNDAAQATADNQPTYVASEVEFFGNAVVRFDGTDDWMALPNPAPFNVGAVTAFAVGKFSNPSGGEQYLLAGQDGGGNDRIRFAIDNGGYEYRIGSSGWRAINTGADTADGDVHAFAITSAAEGFLDGVSVGTSDNTSTEVPVALNIGSYNVGEKAFFSGDIAELVIYDRVLTAQEMTYVTDYLLNKLGTAVAHNPSPVNGDSNVQTDAALSWNTALDEGTGLPRTDVVNHIVYLNANDPNLLTPVATVTAGGSEGSYTPAAELDRDAVYTWRVDEELTGGTILQGPKWSFETVSSTPVVTTQPVIDTLVDAGTAVDLTVEALNPFTSDATGLEYQWYQNSAPVATTATLSIPSAQIDDEGEYYCVVTITSNGATTQSDSGWVNVKRTVQWHSFDGDLTDTIGVNDGVYTNVDPNLITPTFDTGFAGQAISLNGQEYINIGTAGYPRAHSSLEHATIACWIKTAADGRIMGNFNDQPQNSTTGFEFNVTGGNLRCYLRDEDATSIERKSGTGVNDDAWHFVVVAWDASPIGAELSLYLDGASLGTTTSTGTFQPFGDWMYDLVNGARNNRGTVDGFFTGLIDEVKVYNYALTADEVAVAYEGYTGLATCVYPPALDFTGPGPDDSDEDGVFDKDCVVDIYDFAYFASSWLECGLIPLCQ